MRCSCKIQTFIWKQNCLLYHIKHIIENSSVYLLWYLKMPKYSIRTTSNRKLLLAGHQNAFEIHFTSIHKRFFFLMQNHWMLFACLCRRHRCRYCYRIWMLTIIANSIDSAVFSSVVALLCSTCQFLYIAARRYLVVVGFTTATAMPLSLIHEQHLLNGMRRNVNKFERLSLCRGEMWMYREMKIWKMFLLNI